MTGNFKMNLELKLLPPVLGNNIILRKIYADVDRKKRPRDISSPMKYELSVLFYSSRTRHQDSENLEMKWFYFFITKEIQISLSTYDLNLSNFAQNVGHQKNKVCDYRKRMRMRPHAIHDQAY